MGHDARVTSCRFAHLAARLGVLTTIVIFIVCSSCLLAPARAALGDSPQPVVVDDAASLAMVRDSKLEIGARREAVIRLLQSSDALVLESLLSDLKTTNDASLRRVVIQGLKAWGDVPADFAAVVLEVAGELEPVVIDDAGEVVGRAIDAKAFKTISTIAASRAAHMQARQVATLALGYQRTHDAAAALMSLTQLSQPAPIRTAAYAALTRLTGNDDFGADRDRWAQWWSQVRPMSTMQWQDHLIANFARRSETLARQRTALQERLTTALRQRYRAVADNERSDVLIAMLADPIESVRELSLELIREIVNNGQIGAPLTAALVRRLDDGTPAIRAGAALLLRDVKDPGAADIIAQRLANRSERDFSVLRAYLLMMRREPRLAAVAPAIRLLSEPQVRSEAAGALLAAFDQSRDMLNDEQRSRVAQIVRTQLTSDEPPEPRFVELLGRLATAQDWLQIEDWFDHDVPSIKEAAARAWIDATPPRPLAPLAQRAADPVIQAIVIPAATQRGASSETMLGLIEYKPRSEQMAAAWGRALVAMAPRLEPETVVKADARLQQQGESTDLRLQILSAAIDRLLAASDRIGGEPAPGRLTFTLQLIDLLLARAEARLASSDFRAAITDLQRVSDLRVDLAAKQQYRHDLTDIGARIMGNEIDQAFIKVAKYVIPDPKTDDALLMRDRVIDLLINSADHCVTSKQIDRAGQIVTRLRGRLAPPVPLDLETRVSALETKIRAALQSSAGG